MRQEIRELYKSRNEALVSDRDDLKMTWADIGRKYGVSSVRAKQIYVKIYREMAKPPKAPFDPSNLLDKLIDDLPLSNRFKNCIYYYGRYTLETYKIEGFKEYHRGFIKVSDIIHLKDSDLLEIENFGAVTLDEWRDFLKEMRDAGQL
jgi:DNA-directed RNA polymerase alpha subunit